MGIDSGSSGCRAVAMDRHTHQLARSEVYFPAAPSQGLKRERNPFDWWQALLEVFKQLSQEIPLHNVAAVAIDATSGSLVLCTDDGQPVAPALMYNDRQSSEQAARIAQIAPARSGAQGTGSSLAKLLFLWQQQQRGRHALHHHDWLCGQLSGRWGISDENNCLKMGYDPIQRAWPNWLSATQLPPFLFPKVVAPGEPIGPILADICHRLGLKKNTQLFAGTTDSVAATLASGIHKTGEAVTSLGSTLVLKVLSDHPLFVPEFGIYSHRLANHWLVGGASNSGGALLRHFFTAEKIQQLSDKINPEQTSALEYYPLLGPGERFPINDPHFPPKLAPRPDDDVLFLQGLLEGIAAIEDRGYRLMHAHGAPMPLCVYTTGGGAKNPIWRQIRERLLQRVVKIATFQDAAYGSALIARSGNLKEPIFYEKTVGNN